MLLYFCLIISYALYFNNEICTCTTNWKWVVMYVHVRRIYFYSFHMEYLPVKSVPITPKVASSNPVHGEVYSIQHYKSDFKHHNSNPGSTIFLLYYELFQPCSIQHYKSDFKHHNPSHRSTSFLLFQPCSICYYHCIDYGGVYTRNTLVRTKLDIYYFISCEWNIKACCVERKLVNQSDNCYARSLDWSINNKRKGVLD